MGPVPGGIPPGTVTAGVRIGVLCVDPASGVVTELAPPPPGLPSAGDLRKVAAHVVAGGATPTLAAVDLAERQTVAGGYAAPARAAMVSQPIVTYSLIAIFVAIWLLDSFLKKDLVIEGTAGPIYPLNLAGAIFPDQPSEWWRAVAASFLHSPASPFHVAINSYSMFLIGRLVEQLYGRLVMLATFLLTGVAAAIACYVAFSIGLMNAVSVVGASGGLCGLIGLLLMLGRVQGKNVPVGFGDAIRRMAGTNIVFILIYSFALINAGIAVQAHIGGFIGGALLGLVVPPLQRVGGRDLHVVEKAALGAVLAGAAVALVITGAHAVDVLNLINSAPVPGAGPLQ